MLSGGEQQMVSLSRVLVHPSAVVAIDELSHGLAPAIVEQLFTVLAGFRGEMTLVLIEQYVKRAHELADQVVVLSYGQVALPEPRRRRDAGGDRGGLRARPGRGRRPADADGRVRHRRLTGSPHRSPIEREWAVACSRCLRTGDDAGGTTRGAAQPIGSTAP